MMLRNLLIGIQGKNKMQKLTQDSSIHLSVAMLVKVGILVAVVTGSWYQAQMSFNTLSLKVSELHSEVTILNQKMANLEAKKVKNLEEENKSLMQKLGLKRP